MSQPERMAGPQFRGDRPAEQDAVRTTVVGGRPPGSGQKVGPIPRGIEVLLRKAAVDPAFKELLLAAIRFLSRTGAGRHGGELRSPFAAHRAAGIGDADRTVNMPSALCHHRRA